MNDHDKNYDEKEDELAEATGGIPVDIPYAEFDDEMEPVGVECNYVQVVEGEIIDMTNSAAFSLLSEEAHVSDSAVFILRTEEAVVEDSAVFFLAANEVRGNVRPLLTPITAGILGVAILAGLYFFRPRR